MSLAETFEPITWATLSGAGQCAAVRDQLLRGRNAGEAAAQLSVIYGPVYANHIRRVIDSHGLNDEPEVIRARHQRREAEQRVLRARVRARKPVAGARFEKLPQIPALKISGAPARRGVAFMDLQARHCRKPLWSEGADFPDHFYCGAGTEEGQSFCAACRKVLYTPREARVRQVFIDNADSKRKRFS